MSATKNNHSLRWFSLATWLTTTIISSILCGIAGYYLHAWLTRDQISVENVTLVAKKETLKIDPMTFITLSNCTNFYNAFPQLPDSSYSYKSGSVAEGYEEIITTYLDEVREKFNVLNKHYSIVDGIEEDEIEQDTELNNCKDAMDEAIANASKWGDKRTGELELLVSFLNSGDSDGFVRAKAKLHVVGIDEENGVAIRLTQDPNEIRSGYPSSQFEQSDKIPAAIIAEAFDPNTKVLCQ